jgi:hypothetical protein
MFGGGAAQVAVGVGVGVGVTSGEPVTMTPGPGLFGGALFHRFCPNTTSAREMPVKRMAMPSKTRALRKADSGGYFFFTREIYFTRTLHVEKKILAELRLKDALRFDVSTL